MTDMQRLEKDHLAATNFDWEMFVIGWEAGAKWYEGIASVTPAQSGPIHEQNTYTSPDRVIIDRKKAEA
jgi:hypothetical protein